MNSAIDQNSSPILEERLTKPANQECPFKLAHLKQRESNHLRAQDSIGAVFTKLNWNQVCNYRELKANAPFGVFLAKPTPQSAAILKPNTPILSGPMDRTPETSCPAMQLNKATRLMS